MKNLRIVLAFIFVATIGISALSLLLPKPSNEEIGLYYSPIATSVVLVDVLLAIGSAVLFLMALRGFKPELKAAYRLMAFSTIAVGLGLLVFPYIEYYGLWDNLWLNISSYLQYLIGAPLMYFGVRMFYKRVGLHGWAAALPIALAIIVVLSLIHPFLPYDESWPLSRVQYNLFKVVTVIPFVLYGIVGYMALRLRRRTGKEYQTAFIWLAIAMAFYAINTLGIILIEVIGYENPYYANRIYTAPAILGDLGLLFAGYCFAAIGRPKVALGANEAVTSMDIVSYAAGLASDQTKIDAYLDDMRSVTVRLNPGDALSAADQEKLRNAYLKIEDFLVNNDPLRSFKQNELRGDIAHHFGLAAGDKNTFWSSL